MFAALICVISVTLLVQFVVIFWRANMLSLAAQPVSEHLERAQESFPHALDADGFSTLAAISDICPDMGASRVKLGSVRFYYPVLRATAWLCARLWPAASAWAKREMASCTKYAAVAMSHRLEANHEFSVALRSF